MGFLSSKNVLQVEYIKNKQKKPKKCSYKQAVNRNLFFFSNLYIPFQEEWEERF